MPVAGLPGAGTVEWIFFVPVVVFDLTAVI
jgi:hypothetical protein